MVGQPATDLLDLHVEVPRAQELFGDLAAGTVPGVRHVSVLGVSGLDAELRIDRQEQGRTEHQEIERVEAYHGVLLADAGFISTPLGYASSWRSQEASPAWYNYTFSIVFLPRCEVLNHISELLSHHQ